MGHLDGQAAVVTGTAQGIGQAIADLLESAGATVHRVDKDSAHKDSVDLRDSAAVDAFFASLGELHILVNNAGGVQGQTHTPIDELTDAAWEAVVDANLRTAFNCTRAAARIMKRARYGRIVTISSGAGRSVSLTGIQAYTSAKAGQIGFTRQMAHELGPFGITVNCIAPGFVLSNPTTQAQWDGYGEEGQRALLERIATRRTGEPHDIARGVLFFAAPDAGWVSGQTISIDGGHSLF
jgi:3-oxoacyl-[acyl-carrier protein] reductase